MMPKKGDVITPRQCDFCGNSLAEYRGVLESNINAKTIDVSADADANMASKIMDEPTSGELFFCNYEHQADFHAGKIYQP